METILKKSLTNLVEYIEKHLQSECLVVGSMALKVCGFPMEEDPKDLDLEVIDSPRVREALNVLKESRDKKSNPNYPEDSNRYQIDWKGVKVDIWLVKKFEKEYVWKDYIRYATVQEVLKVKLSYRRKKDYDFLVNSIQKLFNYFKLC